MFKRFTVYLLEGTWCLFVKRTGTFLKYLIYRTNTQNNGVKVTIILDFNFEMTLTPKSSVLSFRKSNYGAHYYSLCWFSRDFS